MARLRRFWLAALTVVSLLTGSHVVYAQPIRITGRITEASGQPLPGVNVILRQQNADSTFVSFALTEPDGRYDLVFDSDSLITRYWLSAQLLGFGYQRVTVLTKESINTRQQNFVLSPQAFALNEVVVRAKAIPLKSKGDTTIYNAGSFADGSERSVEDLLKKLPGIKVSEDGTITSKGKRIDKVLIEGEDLFSRNYKLISRSMAANLINKIEAIDNYTDNPLLHGVEKSGKTVLNLTIKDNRKQIVFGNVSVQGGTARRYEGTGSLFSLFQRLKVAAIGQANNIGNDPIPDTEYHLTADDISTPSRLTESQYSPLLAQQTTDTPPISAQRFTFNKARLGALSLTHRVNERLRVKAYSYLSTDNRQLMNILSNNTFLFDSLRLNVRDSSDWRTRPVVWAARFQVNYNKPDRYSLQFSTNWKQTVANTDLFIDSQNLFFPETVRLAQQDRFNVVKHRVEWVRRLSEKSVLMAEGSYLTATLPQTVNVGTRRFADLLTLPPIYNRFTQQAAQQATSYQGSLYWKGNDKTAFYSLGAGYSGEHYQFNTTALLETADGQVRTDAHFGNAGTYATRLYFLDGSYSFQRYPFIFSVNSSLRYALLNYTDGTRALDLTTKRFLWNPTAAIALDMGSQRRLTLALARTQILPTLQNVLAGYVLADYRTLQQGTPTLHVVNSDALVLRYNDFGFSKLYAITASVSAIRERNPYIYQVSVTNSLSLFRLLPHNGVIHQYTAQAEVTRFAKALNVNVQIDGSVNTANLITLQDETLHTSRLTKFEGGLAGVTAFDQAINAELGSRFTLADLADENTDQTTGGLQRSIFIRPRFVLKIRPSKTTRFRLVNEWVHWKNGASVSNLFLTDGLFQWTPSKKPYSLDLIGNNLLNVSVFNYTQFTGNYLIAQRRFMLQPRYVSIRAERRF